MVYTVDNLRNPNTNLKVTIHSTDADSGAEVENFPRRERQGDGLVQRHLRCVKEDPAPEYSAVLDFNLDH